jgi:hypothetical protein
MKIVGILGFKGAGKDTAAQALIDDGYVKYAFADALKDVLSAMFDWPRHMLIGDTKESREWREQVDSWWAKELGIPNFTPRLAMTRIGTDIIRANFNDNIWISNVERRILNSGHDKVVITDCRYENETSLVQRFGGKLVRIKKGDEPEFFSTSVRINSTDEVVRVGAKTIMETKYAHIHSSEWAWNHIAVDALIENDKTIADLQSAIRKAAE